MILPRIARWLDVRLGGSSIARAAIKKVFPDHWSFLLGEIAMYALVVVLLTGAFLPFYYRPSLEMTVYEGSYAPLQGVEMTEAYESVLQISHDVPGGLLVRQMHRWGTLVFIAAIVAHLLRVFVTGAFRRPREANWIVGVTMLVVALVTAYSGYSLPHDLLSGVGMRVGYSLVLSVPLIGPNLASLFFGGEFYSDNMLSRFFFFHILVLPGLLVTLLTVHMAVLLRQKHSQFPGPGRTNRNVVGDRLWPTYTGKTLGLFFIVLAVIAALGGLFQVNPIWLYGPYEPWFLTTPAQPDWYLGWIEGALRLFPPWEVRMLGIMIPNPFFPAVALPGLTFAALYVWPFAEARLRRDRGEHHLLERPRDHPIRTSFAVATVTFYGVLLVAGSNDLIASRLGVAVLSVTFTLRGLALGLPPVAFAASWAACRALVRAERRAVAGKAREES